MNTQSWRGRHGHPPPNSAHSNERDGPYLTKFDGPARIYWGVKDPFFPSEALHAWKKRLPQAQVTELADARH